jgi:glycosyltransferase involved in cell wall biosynthesis
MAYTRLQMKHSVVIPALNEAANISVMLERLSETPGIYEVVVADGGSADGTPNILRSSMYRLVLGENSQAGPSLRHRRPDPAAEEHKHRRPRARKRLRGVPRRQQRRRGYVMLGLREPNEALFRGVPWFTDAVCYRRR